MSPAECHNFGNNFIAKIGKSLNIRYDATVDEFMVYHRKKLILDMTDLRTAKTFIKLEEENE